MHKIGIIVCGVAGRMGQRIALLAKNSTTFQVIGATVRPSHAWVGHDLGVHLSAQASHVLISAGLEDIILEREGIERRAVIDFSSPEASLVNAKLSARLGLPIVVGTTGFSSSQMDQFHQLSHEIPILVAPNTSLGANLLYMLSKIAAEALPHADVEIAEIHHRLKKDSPSGTALFLGQAVAQARNQDFPEQARFNRFNEPTRKEGEIGVFGMRGGNEKGEHTVYFFDGNERIELVRRVHDSDVFAEGALKAAQFLVQQKPGFYRMFDVLNIGVAENRK